MVPCHGAFSGEIELFFSLSSGGEGLEWRDPLMNVIPLSHRILDHRHIGFHLQLQWCFICICNEQNDPFLQTRTQLSPSHKS